MLKNNVIVVTGGAGLLGSAFCRAIISNNATCILADTNKEKSIDVILSLCKEFPNAKIDFQYLDINSKDSILDLIVQIDSKYKKIDAIVNNAYPRNKNYGKKYFDVEYDDFCENINLNLGGYFLVSQKFAEYFIKQGNGNIINISSIYGVIAPRFEIYDATNMTMPVEYAVIKSGLIHLTKYMSKYFKGKNIRVNSISLGGLIDQQPSSFVEKYKENCLNKGMLTPNDITGTLIYFLSDLSEFVNGHNLIVDDGFTL